MGDTDFSTVLAHLSTGLKQHPSLAEYPSEQADRDNAPSLLRRGVTRTTQRDDRRRTRATRSPDLHHTAEDLASSSTSSLTDTSKVNGVMMNPAFLHHPSSFEICGPDLKYPAQDRNYSNLNFPANDYIFSSAKRGIDLVNPSSGSTYSLDQHPHSVLPDASYQTSPQALLSPPDSINGSSAAGLRHPLTSLAHTTLPKPYVSNVSSDHFNGIPGGIFSSTWSGLPMTTYDRLKLTSTLPSTNPYSANGMNNHFLTRSMDPRSYQTSNHPNNSLGQNYASPNGTMRTPTSPYRHGQYYGHDNHYADVSAMPHATQADSKGPGFSDTVVVTEIVNRHGQQLKPDVIASIQKGFFQVDNKWTCYRRNYFQVTCGFTYKGHQDTSLFLRQNDQHKQIHGYAVSISAKTGSSASTEAETRGLVQHTPKRQKNTETTPTRHAVIPQSAQHGHPHNHPSHQYQHHAAGLGMADPLYGSSVGPLLVPHGMRYESVPPVQPSYTFERIQFQKATANNGKRRAQQQFFHVVVELSANVSSDSRHEDWVLLATRESEPMVVRGRSPGHYKDNHHRRDSQAHMDPDRHGGGGGGDGGGGDQSQLYNPYSQSQVGSYESSHSCQHGGYSGTSYRSCLSSHASPPSAGSSTTLNGSPDDGAFAVGDDETLRSTELYSRSQLTPPSESEDEALFSLGRKRPHDDGTADDRSPYRFSPPLCDSISSQALDYPSFSQSKVVCASS